MLYFGEPVGHVKIQQTSKNIPQCYTLDHPVYIIQLEKYKIEFSKCARLPGLLMTRMHDRLTWVEFHALSSMLLLIGQKSKLVKLVYLVNRFFQMSSSRLQTFARKTEMEWQIIMRLLMVIGYVKDYLVGKLSRANCDGKKKTLLQIQGGSKSYS